MSNLWYRELGFKDNPLSIKPAALHDEVIAYDLEEIYDKVEYGDVIFIEGPYGMGKSTILKNIINEFGRDRRIVYYSANRTNTEIKFKDVIKSNRSILGKLLNSNPKDIVLLLDEAEHLKEIDFDNLQKLYEAGNIKSVVFVGSNFEETKINNYFADLVKENVITLTQLSPDEAVSLIRSRLGDTKFVSDEMIKMIYSHSDNNARKLLKNTENVCRYAYEFGDEEILEDHVKEVLAKKE